MSCAEVERAGPRGDAQTVSRIPGSHNALLASKGYSTGAHAGGRRWQVNDTRLRRLVFEEAGPMSETLTGAHSPELRKHLLLETHLRHARNGLTLAIKVFKLLPTDASEKGAPA
jgi:hypothetical protein